VYTDEDEDEAAHAHAIEWMFERSGLTFRGAADRQISALDPKKGWITFPVRF
jgi:hypothetical protein